MTQREREILIASVSWTDNSLTVNEEKAFQAGARWADKTMIDKICNFIIAFNERAKLGIIEPLINVEIFRKAIEE